MEILVNVIGQKLKVTTNLKCFISGSQQFVKFIFNMDDSWDNLTTFAQFRQNDVAYNQYLDANNSVYLPREIGAGACTLILYGTCGDVRATTNYLTLTIDENILVTNAQSTEITQSLYEQLVNSVTTTTNRLQDRVSNVENVIQGLAGGAPIVVSSVSEMTDTDQIYVLSTDGEWYYHNGSAWVSGGEYGAVATDTTLTQSGIPADAKTVGDKIANLKADLSETTRNLFEGKYTDFNGMELSNGKVVNTATDARTSFYCVIRFRNGDTNVTVSNAKVISIAGRQSITVTPNGDGNNLFIAHNGSSKNLTFYFPFNFTSGTTYTISFNVEGYNPSVVGGLVISDIQIQTGDMATAYVPHIVATDYVARSSVDIVEGEISAIRNGIIQIKDDVIDIRNELYNTTEKTITAQPSGYRLNESDGLCSANSSYELVKWLVTAGDYIKIESDDRWQFQTVASVPSSGTSNRIGQTYGAGVFYATVPEGATYLVGSTPVSNSKFKAYNAYAKINSIQGDVLDNNILLYAIGAQTLLSNDAYMNQRGEVTNNSYFKTSDYILVKQDQIIKYKLDSNDSTAIICFFSDKAVSSFVSYVAGTGELSEGTFTVPSDGYIRFSTRTTTIAEAYCYIQADVSPNFAADTMQKIFAGKRIVVFGDSIMADSSCAYTIAEVTGATVYNCAIGGTLMAYGSDSYNIICGAKIAEAINSDSLDDIDVSGLGLSYGNTQHWNTLLGIDFSQIDMAVVSYGTNDFSFNVPTTSETAFDKSAMKTAVDYFISVMNTKYPNVQLCFFTPSYRHRTAWNGDSDEVTNGIGKYLADYENAILESCGNNHVPCKAMYKSCGVNKYNYETYLSDGLHRTSAGGELLGHQYAGFLRDNVI